MAAGAGVALGLQMLKFLPLSWCLLLGCGAVPTPVTGTFPLQVGPAGGVIEGAAGSEFDGVRLEIPAGALSTAVTIDAVFTDEEPELGPGAHFVGPSFEFSPRAQTFAKPVKLTLPVAPTRLVRLEQTTVDCLMWLRAADATWGQATPVSTTEGSVTVEATTLVQAAVGAKSQFVSAPPHPLTRSCVDPDGFCVDVNPERLKPFNAGWSTVAGRKLAYRRSESDGGVTRTIVAEYDLVLGRHTGESSPYTPPSTTPTNFAPGTPVLGPVVQAPDGGAWSPVAHGLVRFPATGAPSLFTDSAVTGKTFGVAFTADGRRHRQFVTGTPRGTSPLVMRLSSTVGANESAAVVLESETEQTSFDGYPFFQVGPSNSLVYLYPRSRLSKLVELTPPATGGPVALPAATLRERIFYDTVAVSDDGDVAAVSTFGPALGERTLSIQSRDGGISRTITSLPVLKALEFGEPGFLYAGADNAAHVYRVELASGAVQTIELTNSTAAADIQARKPLALRHVVLPASGATPARHLLYVIAGALHSNRSVLVIRPSTP